MQSIMHHGWEGMAEGVLVAWAHCIRSQEAELVGHLAP